MSSSELPRFQPVDRPIRLTKTSAAVRQVGLAIRALERGDYDAAITLAGAAEGMINGRPDTEITTELFDRLEMANIPAPYTVKDIANLERN